jgi:hypothetical protein
LILSAGAPFQTGSVSKPSIVGAAKLSPAGMRASTG